MVKRLLITVVLLLVAVVALGCSERQTTERDVLSGDDFPGRGGLADAGTAPEQVPDRVRSLCSPGTTQCVSENSPVIDLCSDDGESLIRDSCPSGEVCRSRRCVPFACAPGTSVCIGNTTAVCDPTGVAVGQTQACQGASVCEGGRCVDLCEVAAQTGSYIGCEYVALRLPNYYEAEDDADAFPFGVVVANAHPFAPATVEMTHATGNAIELWAPREVETASRDFVSLGSEVRNADGSVEPIERSTGIVVPPGGAAVVMPETGTKIVHIASDRPVSAYQFSPYCCNSTYTNDASLLFPVNTWESRYRGIGYPDFPRLEPPYLALYSTVEQEVRVDTPIRLGSVSGVVDDGDTITISAGRVFYLNTDFRAQPGDDGSAGRGSDLSGVELTSEEPMAVFYGHPCTFVPEGLSACDHLEAQLPPADTLGREYLLTPIRQRARPPLENSAEGVYWRVAADEDVTVSFEPPLGELDLLPPANEFTRLCVDLLDGGELRLDEGETCAFGTLSGVALRATGDVTVAGVISGQQSTGLLSFGAFAGDPSFFILPPAAQFRESYSFVAPPTYRLNFVSVAVPVGAAVVLDGRNVEEDFRLQRQVVNLSGRRWELFTVPIEPGLHQMSSDDPFGIMVYAYDDYVSYAFVGGLNLLPKGAR